MKTETVKDGDYKNMRIKVYLNPSRDLELIAIRFSPELDFCGIAKEALKSHVRNNGKYRFMMKKTDKLMNRSMVCYISLDENEDADIIEYLTKISVSPSAFIRNIMVHSVDFADMDVYTDKNLNNTILSYRYDKKQKMNKNALKKKLKEQQKKDE
jgi:hypothetical protein